MKRNLALLLPLCACALFSCGAKKSASPAAQGSIALDVTSLTLPEERTHQFRAEVIGASGEIAYEVRDEAIASITQTGLLTALSVGSTQVYARCGALSAACQLSVVPYEPEDALSLTLAQSEYVLSLSFPEPYAIAMEVRYGEEKVADYRAAYAVSDPAVCRVAEGKITPLAVGESKVSVSVSYREQTASAELSVEVK